MGGRIVGAILLLLIAFWLVYTSIILAAPFVAVVIVLWVCNRATRSRVIRSPSE